MIVVLVPVLGRPANAQPLADSLVAASPGVRLVFICNPGDDEQIAACDAAALSYPGRAMVIHTEHPRGPGDFARKINLAFKFTDEPFVFQAADDVEFRPGWDDAALRVAEDTGAGVVGTNDLANPVVKRGQHSTHSLIRRSYANHPGASADGPGTVFSEAYGHAFCDNELVELAKRRKQWAFAESSHVLHRHWVWGTAEKDATYRVGMETFQADARVFHRRRRAFR